jgi:phosphoribosylglycinamide formyltransferase-1
MSLRCALFASGAGSNALNLLTVAKSLPAISFELVIVDQEASPLPKRVRELYPNLAVEIILAPNEKNLVRRRALHEAEILKALRAKKIEWIFLAGYMRIIGETLLDAYSSQGNSRIVNIHPSLLPAYPGLHAYERAFAAQDKNGGVTVHLVDVGVDTGPILAQESFPRETDDSLFDFTERGKAIEWKLYADVLRQLNDTKNLQTNHARPVTAKGNS